MTVPAKSFSEIWGSAPEGTLDGVVHRGAVIADRYRLEEVIGAGGMARVWRAHDRRLDQSVAVKFLFLREDRDQETMIDRFLREARIAASVRHPNVVDVFDFGTIPTDGRPFIVMELLEGQSLDDRLGVEPASSVQTLMRMIGDVLEGLEAVHEVGIVHRDIKPGNIFLVEGEDGVHPKLIDFGVSRDTDASSGRRSALTTNAGYLVGTPEYMSPEQARGLKDIDWRTDLYSVGVLLYEALIGALPYDAAAVGDLIIEIVGGEAPPVFEVRPEVGEALSSVIATAMAPAREDRFQSAEEMRAALLGLVGQAQLQDIFTRPPSRVRLGELPLSAGPSSLDGELAWGAGAVPSFDAPAETPRARAKPWTIDTQLTSGVKPAGARPRSKARYWIAAGLIAPVVGVALSLLLWEPAGPVETTPLAEETPPPAQPPAARVTVTLGELPANARVLVDGETVEIDGGSFELPQDGAEHTIRVEARSWRPWTTVHRADGDGVYRVRLRRTSSARRNQQPGDFRDLDH